MVAMSTPATAAVTSSTPTSMGSAARRAGQSTPWKPALAAVHTNRCHTAGWGSDALTANPPTAAAMASWVRTTTFFRSMASASVPPQRAPANSGHKLGQADQADDECRMGQLIRLERHRHQGELRADPRHHLAFPQAAELRVPAKRSDVDDEPGHHPTVPAGDRGPRAAPTVIGAGRGASVSRRRGCPTTPV